MEEEEEENEDKLHSETKFNNQKINDLGQSSRQSVVSERQESKKSNNSESHSESGYDNLGFEVEPPLMYSNGSGRLLNAEALLNSLHNLNTMPDNEYEYYSKC